MSFDDPRALQAAFEQQVRWCERYDAPFMARLLRSAGQWAATAPEARGLFAVAAGEPGTGLWPLRLAAGLHDLALQGLPPFAELWAAPAVATEMALGQAARHAGREHAATLAAFLASAPQTNEVQRSAVLLPGLKAVAAATGLPLYLLELGASAGLNLWCDQFAVRADAWAHEPVRPPLALQVQWRGAPPPTAVPHVVGREGCDLAPLQLADAAQQRKLLAYIWPDQPERLARMRQALVAASTLQTTHPVHLQAADALDFARQALAQVRPGRATVVMHSVFWQYLPADTQAALRATLEAALAGALPDAPVAWLSMEHPGADAPCELRLRLAPHGIDTRLALCHSHGTWVEWA